MELVPVRVISNLGTISDNLQEVEASIREKVKEYHNIVVTEETIQDGKKILADIRKEKEGLEQERKTIKKAWMKPYEAFEKRAKELIALYDEPVQILDSQLKEFEKQRKREKQQEIQRIYDAAKGDLEEWLPLSKVYDEKWESSIYSKKKIREEIEQAFRQVERSIQTIQSMQSEFEKEGLAVLKTTESLQAAIEEMQTRKRIKEEILAQEQRKREEEQRRREEEQRKREEEEKRKEEEQRKVQELQEILSSQPEETEKELEKVPVFQAIEQTEETLEPFEAVTRAEEIEPFMAEPEVMVKVYVRESFLKEFQEFLRRNYIRFEEE